MKIVGQLVIFGEPPIFRLVLGDDGVHRVVRQFLSVDWFAAFLVSLAFPFQEVWWDSQSDLPIDLSLSVGLIGVILEG